MKFHCPSCDAPFDSQGRTVSTVKCPNCGAPFAPKALPSPRRSRYTADVERRAADLVAEINRVAASYDDSVRKCALMVLEDEWLGPRGHWVTIKLGANSSANGAECSICHKDTTGKGFELHIISRWRATTTTIYLCEEHRGLALHATDVDLHKTNICPRLSWA